jgi:hypothetical protein
MSGAASKAVAPFLQVVALKRASVAGLELSACSIRVFLFADVLADLFQFKSDRGHGVTACPEVFPGKVSFPPAQSGNRNRTLPLQEPDHRGHWVLGWNGDAHGPASDALR